MLVVFDICDPRPIEHAIVPKEVGIHGPMDVDFHIP